MRVLGSISCLGCSDGIRVLSRSGSSCLLTDLRSSADNGVEELLLGVIDSPG